jgi:hypothetical protein
MIKVIAIGEKYPISIPYKKTQIIVADVTFKDLKNELIRTSTIRAEMLGKFYLGMRLAGVSIKRVRDNTFFTMTSVIQEHSNL